MTVRRPIVRIGGRNRQLPAGDTLQDVPQWYFGTGTPNDGGGAPSDYFVASDNKLWRKGATTWTYTGVQYGSLVAVSAKTTPVDPDVLSLGDSANGFQMARLTLANLRAFLGGGVGYRSVTAATTLAASDSAKIIDCSGTWTLALTAAATLTAGWWCYVRNSGTGTITIDPNGNETIDTLILGTLLPGMTLLVQCDGTAFRCIRVGPLTTTQLLTTGTSWVVPLGVRAVRVRGVGGGGGGGGASDNSRTSGPGGAGGYFEVLAKAVPGAACSYGIGAAGSAASSGGMDGGTGGTTQITINGVTYTANGGVGGSFGNVYSVGGTATGTGAILIAGGNGMSFTSATNIHFSQGGDSELGKGAVWSRDVHNTPGFGAPATGYGSGGAGAQSASSSTPGRVGVIILEY